MLCLRRADCLTSLERQMERTRGNEVQRESCVAGNEVAIRQVGQPIRRGTPNAERLEGWQTVPAGAEPPSQMPGDIVCAASGVLSLHDPDFVFEVVKGGLREPRAQFLHEPEHVGFWTGRRELGNAHPHGSVASDARVLTGMHGQVLKKMQPTRCRQRLVGMTGTEQQRSRRRTIRRQSEDGHTGLGRPPIHAGITLARRHTSRVVAPEALSRPSLPPARPASPAQRPELPLMVKLDSADVRVIRVRHLWPVAFEQIFGYTLAREAT